MDRAYWDSLAESFEDDLLEIAREEGAGVLKEEIAVHGNREHTVADLGCGPGSLIPFLAGQFGKVVAVDYAEELLAVARARCREPNVSYQCHDLGRGIDLPFAVEVACCVNALIDPRERKREGMLRALRTAVTPGGVALIVVPAFESVFHVFHTLRGIRRREGAPAGLTARGAERQLVGEVASFAGGVVKVGGVDTKCWMRRNSSPPCASTASVRCGCAGWSTGGRRRSTILPPGWKVPARGIGWW